MNLSLAQRAALADCDPTLKNEGRCFRRAPGASRVTHDWRAVHQLLEAGLLAWGNPSHRFVVRTEAGAAALKEAA